MSEADALRARFAATAADVATREESRRAELTDRVRHFVEPRGDERALDAGTGTGALAFALAPLVKEVVGVDLVPELLDEARKRGADFPNVSFREGDITSLPRDLAGFDLTGTLRTIHHIQWPELAIAELARVTGPGGRLLVVDQLAPTDPLVGLELDRFERARDPTYQRALADTDFRQLFESNNLVVERAELETETRELEPYLDRAGLEGEAREAARTLAPAERYTVTVGWYLVRRFSP